MFICNCNALNHAQVCAAVLDGATTAPAVYARCGGAERCGSCLPQILDVIERIAGSADDLSQGASEAA